MSTTELYPPSKDFITGKLDELIVKFPKLQYSYSLSLHEGGDHTVGFPPCESYSYEEIESETDKIDEEFQKKFPWFESLIFLHDYTYDKETDLLDLFDKNDEDFICTKQGTEYAN